LPPREACALVATLADAVDYAHRCGVVHRDLKPANVLFVGGQKAETKPSSDPSAFPKVADFGLAKRLGEEQGQPQGGDLLGRPSYRARGQARGAARSAGPAADVWALGAVLYACLTGRPPFEGATALQTLTLVCDSDPVPPSRQRGVPR